MPRAGGHVERFMVRQVSIHLSIFIIYLLFSSNSFHCPRRHYKTRLVEDVVDLSASSEEKLFGGEPEGSAREKRRGRWTQDADENEKDADLLGNL